MKRTVGTSLAGRIVLTLAVAAVAATPVLAGGDEPDDELATLRAENRMLRSTVHRLRARIAELQSRRAETQANPRAPGSEPTTRPVARRPVESPESAQRPDAPQADWPANELHKLALACQEASFGEQHGAIEFTSRETGQTIATVTAAEFILPEYPVEARIHMRPADGQRWPPGYVLVPMAQNLVDMRLREAAIGRIKVRVLYYDQGPQPPGRETRPEGVRKGTTYYTSDPARRVSTAIPTSPPSMRDD